MRRSVLLVDDNPADLLLLCTAIEEMGWRVDTATAADGAEAMETLARSRARGLSPELVLLDLNMPRMNGWELIAAMKRHGYEARCIAMTTSALDTDHERAVGLGAERCYVKPSSYDGLIEIMQEIRRALGSGEHLLPT